jgi:hypothetical protein
MQPRKNTLFFILFFIFFKLVSVPGSGDIEKKDFAGCEGFFLGFLGVDRSVRRNAKCRHIHYYPQPPTEHSSRAGV